MSTTAPDQPWSGTIQPTDINNVTCTVSGNPQLYKNDPQGGGKYKVSLTGGQVKCPGPIVFKEGSTVLLTVTISPC